MFWGNYLSIWSRIFIFLWLRKRQKQVGWAHLFPGSPLPGSYQMWAWPGDHGRRLAFLLHCWFPWEPRNSQGQTFPCNAEADKSNLSSKQVILLQNLTKKGEGHFPWLEILSYFESKLTERLYDFLWGGYKGKKKKDFMSLIEYPYF